MRGVCVCVCVSMCVPWLLTHTSGPLAVHDTHNIIAPTITDNLYLNVLGDGGGGWGWFCFDNGAFGGGGAGGGGECGLVVWWLRGRLRVCVCVCVCCVHDIISVSSLPHATPSLVQSALSCHRTTYDYVPAFPSALLLAGVPLSVQLSDLLSPPQNKGIRIHSSIKRESCCRTSEGLVSSWTKISKS